MREADRHASGSTPYFRLQREAQPQHHPQLDGQQQRGVFYDLADEIRTDGSQRLLGIDAGLPGRAAGSAAVPAECRRRGAALSQPSVDHRSGSAATKACRSRSSTKALGDLIARARRHALVHGHLEQREPAGHRARITTARRWAISPDPPPASRWRSARRRFPRSSHPRRMVPTEDRWPLSDTLAYHDWHFGGNGDTKTFMDALDTVSARHAASRTSSARRR